MLYPLFLDLSGRAAVVVGAGQVATRKIQSLLRAGARITVISPQSTSTVARWASTRRVSWRRRAYRAGDLRTACLAIAATDQPAVNRRVCAEAKRRGILVNCVAPPAAGNFHVPALARRGRICLAISTGGGSPAVAKQLRRELEQYLRTGYGAFAKQIRARLSRVGAKRRRAKRA